MSTSRPAGPVTVIVIGAGNRATIYAQFALKFPERMKVVAVVDPDPMRRDRLADAHAVPAENRFDSYEKCLAQPRFADAVINGTMDRLHYESTMPALDKGYHVLLEKPIAPTEQQVCDMIAWAAQKNCHVMICHVLRYTPFFARFKQLINEGAVGDIVTVHINEHVSYHHMAVAYVRGRWNREDTSNPMILAKCCHHTDAIAWLLSGHAVRRVASFGSLQQFKPQHAPQGSTARCLDGCAVESSCAYSAKANYVIAGKWRDYAFENHVDHTKLTETQLLDSLKSPQNRYGRCVWRCDNDVVDHQNVMVEFDNGVTASLNMHCSPQHARNFHVIGTAGELRGSLEDATIEWIRPCPANRDMVMREIIDTRTNDNHEWATHYGGDSRLIADFVSLLRAEPTSSGYTRIEDSLTGHLIAFAAEQSRHEHRVIEFK